MSGLYVTVISNYKNTHHYLYNKSTESKKKGTLLEALLVKMNSGETLFVDKIQYITEENVKLIVSNYGDTNDDTLIDNYTVNYASDKMLGFLADYLKLQISVVSNNERKVICCFIKAISKTNAAKADMVHEMGLFKKESHFYSVIKSNIVVPGKKF